MWGAKPQLPSTPSLSHPALPPFPGFNEDKIAPDLASGSQPGPRDWELSSSPLPASLWDDRQEVLRHSGQPRKLLGFFLSFLIFKKYLFSNLFGCTGSLLWQAGSFSCGCYSSAEVVGSSSLTRDGTQAPGIESAETWPLDRQGRPRNWQLFSSLRVTWILHSLQTGLILPVHTFTGTRVHARTHTHTHTHTHTLTTSSMHTVTRLPTHPQSTEGLGPFHSSLQSLEGIWILKHPKGVSGPLPAPQPRPGAVPTLTCMGTRRSRRDSPGSAWWAGEPPAARWRPPDCKT